MRSSENYPAIPVHARLELSMIMLVGLSTHLRVPLLADWAW